MTNLNIGDDAPKFNLPAEGELSGTVDSNKIKGPYVVYFYPKDDTPGCTKEAIGFTAQKAEFDALGVKIIGVSKDTLAKHNKFICKHSLDLTLLSDEEGSLCEAYGVWVEKNLYGRKYMGIERATFLIDAQGKIAHIWRKVKVKDHVEDVLEKAKSL
ncbi:MAG: thioredoxin-dependent thiol peroxidase [Pseudomonadota bacterium]|jgi:peroxiredoxin Q/BCP|nr:thioredoxin-dependent thiol peroxidase [Alphaproteobacteria bacterium]MEC7703034.1 thioredoxin-dependent thiol peroxidase [Pseudomonadota bacterium]MCS5597726.1 thioredoxin-dependent thiol peroxidase [Alphaproteobacteria bacterium]MEC9236311.1 thioredoxin-dependent thiol peroxidase [Pseudomonadota bacterium]MED5422669.1 thioredoxin-dependent thiol peroxidase [Pseudomonadota bacterium]|tara:strand:- start:2047 stop:2517 length:471 start_codon:yes stop_codon:yes gene_type:complete